jgi:hypothetical protein
MMRPAIDATTLRGMGRQDVFDYAARHLMTMGRACMRLTALGEECMYRDGKGGACVVGAFIPDEVYSERLEGHGIGKLALYITDPVVRDFLMRHAHLLWCLQRIHDQAPAAHWLSALHGLAMDLHLSSAILTQYRVDREPMRGPRFQVRATRAPVCAWGPMSDDDVVASHQFKTELVDTWQDPIPSFPPVFAGMDWSAQTFKPKQPCALLADSMA